MSDAKISLDAHYDLYDDNNAPWQVPCVTYSAAGIFALYVRSVIGFSHWITVVPESDLGTFLKGPTKTNEQWQQLHGGHELIPFKEDVVYMTFGNVRSDILLSIGLKSHVPPGAHDVSRSRLVVWSVPVQRRIREINDVCCVAFNADDSVLATAGTSPREDVVTLYDAKAGNFDLPVLRKIAPYDMQVQCLQFLDWNNTLLLCRGPVYDRASKQHTHTGIVDISKNGEEVLNLADLLKTSTATTSSLGGAALSSRRDGFEVRCLREPGKILVLYCQEQDGGSPRYSLVVADLNRPSEDDRVLVAFEAQADSPIMDYPGEMERRSPHLMVPNAALAPNIFCVQFADMVSIFDLDQVPTLQKGQVLAPDPAAATLFGLSSEDFGEGSWCWLSADRTTLFVCSRCDGILESFKLQY